MKKICIVSLLSISLLALSGCSDKQDEKPELLWQEQVNTYDKAKGVEDLLKQSDDARRQKIDEMQK